MDYYKRYMGDYQRDTSHLSLTEHGAYSLLLDHYYSRRRPLPASIEALYRLCRATTRAEQMAVDAVAAEFFGLAPDGLRHNPRADDEIEKWEELASLNRERGKLGGRPKANPSGNPGGSGTGNPEQSRKDMRAGSSRVPKTGENETRTKPSPAPTPDPDPEAITRTRSITRNARAPEAVNGHGEGNGRGDEFQQVRAAYPNGTYRQANWLRAEHEALNRVEEGATWQELIEGVQRYRAQCDAKGSTGTQFVLSPEKFFDPAARPWRDPFPLPARGSTYIPPKSIEQLEAEERSRAAV